MEIVSIPVEERKYILSLIAEARQTIKEVKIFGQAGKRQIAAEISGALVLVANYSDEPKQQREAGNLIVRILTFAMSKFGGKALEGAADHVIKAITSNG